MRIFDFCLRSERTTSLAYLILFWVTKACSLFIFLKRRISSHHDVLFVVVVADTSSTIWPTSSLLSPVLFCRFPLLFSVVSRRREASLSTMQLVSHVALPSLQRGISLSSGWPRMKAALPSTRGNAGESWVVVLTRHVRPEGRERTRERVTVRARRVEKRGKRESE